MITYHEISLSDLTERIADIDVSEHGAVVYYWINNEVRSVAEEWDRPKRTKESWLDAGWFAMLGLKDLKAWGAFDNEDLVGMIIYRPQLTEDMAQLVSLFTDKDHRRMGIASQLTQLLIQRARDDGHTSLYVSATPSESAVNFYLCQGFIPTQQAHPELFALEPEDIHMIKNL